MTNVEYRTMAPYRAIPKEQLYNSEFVDSLSEGAQLINNTLICYAQSQRTLTTHLGNYPIDSDVSDLDMVLAVPANSSKTIFDIKGAGMMTGASRKIKVWIYSKTASTNTMHLHLECGNHKGVLEDIDGTTFAWYGLEIECDQMESTTLSEARPIRASVVTEGTAETITIRSISLYEPSDPSAPDWIDTTDATENQLGQADWPWSAAATHIINNNIKACYGNRVPRKNILAQCFTNPKKTLSSSYDADSRGLGTYIIEKSAGMTTIDGRIFVHNDDTKDFYIKVEARSLNSTSKPTVYTLVDSDEVNVNPGANNEMWIDIELTGLSSDATEYEIRIDAKQDETLAYVFVWLNAFTEGLEGASERTYTLPNKTYAQQDDDIIYKEMHNCKTTLEQVWERKRQILINNSRWTKSVDNYEEFVWPTLLRPYDVFGLLYPSEGSTHVICRCLCSVVEQRTRGQLAYDGNGSAIASDTFAEGETLLGATSGATGVIVYDDATNDILFLRNIHGTFINNEQITDTGTGDAFAAGIVTDVTSEDIDLELNFETWYGYYLSLTDVSSHEMHLGDRKDEEAFIVEFKIPVPREGWNQIDEILGGGLHDDLPMFSLWQWPYYEADLSDNPIKYLKFNQIQVYEETRAVL